jgi:hypothetical protein
LFLFPKTGSGALEKSTYVTLKTIAFPSLCKTAEALCSVEEGGVYAAQFA